MFSALLHMGTDYSYTTYDYSTASSASVGSLIVIYLIALVVGIIAVVGMWKAFVKAGKPGWAAIVPIYNMVVLLEIASRPIWWVLLMFVPIVSLVVAIIVYIDIAKAFGKSAGFGIFNLIFPFIGWMMLGFGSAQYHGSGGAPSTPTMHGGGGATPPTNPMPQNPVS